VPSAKTALPAAMIALSPHLEKKVFLFSFLFTDRVRGCRLRTWKIASARRRHCEHAPEIVLHCLQAPRTHMPPLPHLYFFILYFITTTGHTGTVPHHQRPTFYREDILLLLLTHRHCAAPPTPHILQRRHSITTTHTPSLSRTTNAPPG
jgi:hypothetical protein